MLEACFKLGSIFASLSKGLLSICYCLILLICPFSAQKTHIHPQIQEQYLSQHFINLYIFPKPMIGCIPPSPHHPLPLQMLLWRFWHSLGKGGGKWVGKGGSSRASYQGPLLSKQTKRTKHKRGKNPSLRVRASLRGNPARKFKVALRMKATGIKDVLTLLFKDHLWGIGSLIHTQTPILQWKTHTVTHPCIHNGKQRPQQL